MSPRRPSTHRYTHRLIAMTIGLAYTVLLLAALSRAGVRAEADPTAAQSPTAPPLATPNTAPIQSVGDQQIHLYEFAFDPLTTDLATTQGVAESATNDAGQGLFLVQFSDTPNDFQLNALGPDVTYVQYVPNNTFAVWTTPAALLEAQANSFVRWTGSFYPDLRVAPEARAAVAAATATANSTPLTVEATFIDDGSLDRLADLVVANGGVIDYREPAAVMSESLAAERWRFSLGGDALPQVLRRPSLLTLEPFDAPRIAESRTNSFLADATQNPDDLPYSPWLKDVGVNGDGVKIAVIDTGVDWDHPDLQNVVSGQEAGGYTEHFKADGKTPQEQPGSDGAPRVGDGNPPGHGTHVAGSAAGTGTTALTGQSPLVRYGQGTAPGATIHAVDFLASDSTYPSQANMHTTALTAGADLSTNSYGGSISQGYTSESSTQDAVALDVAAGDGVRQPMLMIFAAANAGGGNPYSGSSPCAPGWPDTSRPCDRSLATHAEAKNVITVGALNSPHATGQWSPGSTGLVADWQKKSVTVAHFSSRGPAIDGRIKPDVVAPGLGIISTENRFVEAGGVTGGSCDNSTGLTELFSWCDGTSMATPAVAGVAALFTQHWRDHILAPDPGRDEPTRPEPATVKAALIVTADRIGNRVGADDGWGHSFVAWPNGHEGWGRVNADRLLDPPVPIVYFENPQVLTDVNDSWTTRVKRSDPLEPMKIVLVWSDAPGAAGAKPALVNNLNLFVTRPGTNTLYCGNYFEPANQLWSQDCNGAANTDKLNNVETIIVPGQGTFDIEVKAQALNGNGVRDFGDDTDQHFSVVCYNCEAAYHVDDSVNDGLVAYYKFDEGDGTTVMNSAADGLPLTFNSPANSFSTNGGSQAPLRFRNFNGLQIDGTDGPAINYNAAFEPQEALSIALWVWPTTYAVTNLQYLFGQPGGVPGGQPGATYKLSLNSSYQAVFSVNDNKGTLKTITGGMVPRQTWTHVAATWAKDGYLRLYVNGVEVAKTPAGNAPLGQALSGPRVGANYTGNIDELRFYKKRLREAEVKRLARGLECETSGTGWGDAFRFVDCGLVAASQRYQGAEIRVAKGTYTPGTNRDASFQVGAFHQLVGGYDGTNTNRRNWQAFPTILSGDLDRNDNPGVNGLTGRNSYHVVMAWTTGTLDGFIIEHGLANRTGNGRDVGAGIYSQSADDRTFKNLIVRENFAKLVGGGLAAYGEGGLTVRESKFLGNKAAFGGGAQFFTKHTNVLNSVFSGNEATTSTGGAGFSLADSVNVISSTFFGNKAPFAGGMRLEGATSSVGVTANIFYGNEAPLSPQISDLGPDAFVRENIIEGGFPGIDNLVGDPLFADPDGEDNVLGTVDDNLHLTQHSPAIDSATLCTITDLNGLSRQTEGNFDGNTDNACDRGAHEYGTILLVQDNPFNKSGLGTMIDALDTASLVYEVWQGKPSASRLAGHPRVLWFTGDYYDTTGDVGPGDASETAVAQWLDSGQRCLLLSSQNYITSHGGAGQPKPFAKQYFGMANTTQDASPTYKNLAGVGLFSSQSYGLQARPAVPNLGRNDLVGTDGQVGSQLAFLVVPDGTKSAGITKETDRYRTGFFAFAIETIGTGPDSAAAQRGQMAATFFNTGGPRSTIGCEPTAAPPAAALELSISPSQPVFYLPYEDIYFTFDIENRGPAIITGTVAIDFTIAGESVEIAPCGTVPLMPGATTQCGGSYSTTLNDMAAGSILTAGSVSSNGIVSAEAASTIPLDGPRLLLDVATNPQVFTAVGQPIVYTFTIHSVGTQTATGPFFVVDQLFGESLCGNQSLAPRQSLTCQFTHQVTAGEMATGAVDTRSAASGTDSLSPIVATTTQLAVNALALEMSANRETYRALGDEIVYTYVIRNVGEAPLSGPFSVTDSLLGTIASCGAGPLAPDAQTSCTSGYTVTQADLDAGAITSATSAAGNGLTSAQDSVTVVREVGSLSLQVSANRTTFDQVGDRITYTYVVRNTGAFPLAGPFTVTDDKLGRIAPCGGGPLNPGAQTTCSADYVITASDVAATVFTNWATVAGNDLTSPAAAATVLGPLFTPSSFVSLPVVVRP